jgi:hypothetical protein
VWPGGRNGPARVSTLHCPSASPSCRKLAAVPWSAFAPTPSERPCIEIHGGPQEALVTGTFRGRRVWARFSREDGCEIARWNRLSFLFAK